MQMTINSSQSQQWNVLECASFKKTSEEFGAFSNMAGAAAGLNKLIVAGIHIRTSEHLYQALRYPERADIQQEILDQASPMFAKRIAKKNQYLPYCRKDWAVVQLDIMRWAIRTKLVFNYNQLGRVFLLSGRRPIVEIAAKDSPTSRYWGTVLQGETFVGANVLGQLLMELRCEFLAHSRQEMLVVRNPIVSGCQILGHSLG